MNYLVFAEKKGITSVLRLEDSSGIEGKRAQAARAETNDLHPCKPNKSGGGNKTSACTSAIIQQDLQRCAMNGLRRLEIPDLGFSWLTRFSSHSRLVRGIR